MQDAAFSNFFRFYLKPFHPYTRAVIDQAGGRLGRMDRVEAFVAAIDSHETRDLRSHEDDFRVFARFVCRSIASTVK